MPSFIYIHFWFAILYCINSFGTFCYLYSKITGCLTLFCYFKMRKENKSDLLNGVYLHFCSSAKIVFIHNLAKNILKSGFETLKHTE